MQLCAYDLKKNLIFSSKAKKHFDYFCLECGQKVRLRSGEHRQPHFYHLNPNIHCKQDGKGIVHLMIQYHFQNILTPEKCSLEYRFPSISRIADVVWHENNLVFEIQCAAISFAEVEQRNRDYASLGYQVVWILHDNRYNGMRVSAAEGYLQDHPHYYTNMDANGEGIIYDQFAMIHLGKRVKRLIKLPVDILTPKKWDPQKQKAGYPKEFLNKRQKWPLHFKGDCVDLAEESEIYEQLNSWHQEERTKEVLSWYDKWVVHPYKALLHLFVERSCK